MTQPTGYSRLQISLHWLIAILILAAWLTGEGMGRVLETRIETGATGITGNTPHVWMGGAIFALVLIRLVVRWMQGAPGPVPGSSPLAEAAAVWGHRLLYLLMVLAPLGGAVTWYGGVTSAGEVHELIGNALFFVALAHAAVAVAHQFILKDNTLMRMLRVGQ